MGSLTIAAVAAWVALGRGRSMLGRPRAWLLATVVLVPLAYLTWKLGATARFPAMNGPWPARPGWLCLRLSLLTSAFPLAAVVYMRRRSDPTHPYALGAALGAAVAACSTLLVDLWCPVAHVDHLLRGHVLPIAIVTVIGAWLGGRFVAIRAIKAES
jgi:hypothetical protein